MADQTDRLSADTEAGVYRVLSSAGSRLIEWPLVVRPSDWYGCEIIERLVPEAPPKSLDATCRVGWYLCHRRVSPELGDTAMWWNGHGLFTWSVASPAVEVISRDAYTDFIGPLIPSQGGKAKQAFLSWLGDKWLIGCSPALVADKAAELFAGCPSPCPECERLQDNLRLYAADINELRAECEKLKAERDKLNREFQACYDKLGEWQEMTGCSCPATAKAERDALKAEARKA